MEFFVQPHKTWSDMLRPSLFINVYSTAPIRIRGLSLDFQERCLLAVSTKLATLTEAGTFLKFPYVTSTRDPNVVLVTIDSSINGDAAASFHDEVLKLPPIQLFDDNRDLLSVLSFTPFDAPSRSTGCSPSLKYQCEIGPLPPNIILDAVVDIIAAILRSDRSVITIRYQQVNRQFRNAAIVGIENMSDDQQKSFPLVLPVPEDYDGPNIKISKCSWRLGCRVKKCRDEGTAPNHSFLNCPIRTD